MTPIAESCLRVHDRFLLFQKTYILHGLSSYSLVNKLTTHSNRCHNQQTFIEIVVSFNSAIYQGKLLFDQMIN